MLEKMGLKHVTDDVYPRVFVGENPGPRRSVSSTPMTWDPYREENSEQLVLIVSGACRDSE